MGYTDFEYSFVCAELFDYKNRHLSYGLSFCYTVALTTATKAETLVTGVSTPRCGKKRAVLHSAESLIFATISANLQSYAK
jgi:hypothetical protein